MANDETMTLDELLIPSLLPRAYDFWFQHIPSNEHLLLPSPEDWKKWFFKSDEFDSACTSQFSPILAAIHEANLSAEDILSRTHPSTPQDWLALSIVLDQPPRNIYRGESSRIVFEFFDPLARTIALKAADAGYSANSPFRYRQAQRIWFYLPFIHAEDLRMQGLASEKYQEMAGDLTRLLDGDAMALSLSDDEQECQRVLAENRARLGRFPHRNEALGRVMSEEEKRFMEGGDTSGR